MVENIGIIGIGVYLPKQIMTAKDIADATKGVWTEQAVIDKLGIKQKLVANQDEGAQEMSYLAAKNCLEDANIDPLDIDVIISVTEEWKEYPLTTSALYVQGKIGADNAWGIDVQNRCSTTCSALKMAKDMLIADEEIDTIMIVGGYRNGDFVNYEDKTMSMMFNLSAGGGALLLRKGVSKNLILGSHIIADGSLARTAGVKIGGSANPITCDNINEAYQSLTLMQPKFMKDRLNEVSMDNWFTCIDESLRKSKLTRDDIDYLAILHIKRSGHNAMLNELNLTPEQTHYLENYGHIGQIDQILSLYLGIKSGQIQPGHHVCMIAAGIGYVWASTIVRWG
jgi:3-oxoacyl-[acyl-carrier-protein] synthase-3